jgi:hypothetical protein
VVGGRGGEADDDLLAGGGVRVGVLVVGVDLGVLLRRVAGAGGEQGAGADRGATEEDAAAGQVGRVFSRGDRAAVTGRRRNV